MAYLSAQADDHGLIEFGCHSYGGLAINDNHPLYTLPGFSVESDSGDENAEDKLSAFHFTQPSTSTDLLNPAKPYHRYVSEHNLALLWRRPGIFPRSDKAFPMPLLETHDYHSDGLWRRPPGNFRYDGPRVRHRNRNLLAGKWCKDSQNRMRLWTVNDSSDGQMLLLFTLGVGNSRNHPDLLVVEQQSDVLRITLPVEAVELRPFSSEKDVDDKVFVRTKRSLLLVSPDEVEATIFRSSVRSFTQIPYMEEEIAVVDPAGLLFWGDFTGTSSLARLKFPYEIKAVCATDCPRQLLALTEKELIQADLRLQNDAGQLIYSLSGSGFSRANTAQVLCEASYEYTRTRELLCHVNLVDAARDAFILTTTCRHLLMDRRMFNREVLAMPHAEIDGSDFCYLTEPFHDEVSGGEAFSFYSLSHSVKPTLAHWPIMYHPSLRMWSSLGAKHEIRSPSALMYRFANLYFGEERLPDRERFELPSVTRAVYRQNLPAKFSTKDTHKALLFRQMDGGSLWYETVEFNMAEVEEKTDDSLRNNNALYSPVASIRSGRSRSYSVDTSSSDMSALRVASFKHVCDYYERRATEFGGDIFHQNVDEKFLTLSSSLLEHFDARPFLQLSPNKNNDISFSDVFPAPFSNVWTMEAVPESVVNSEVVEEVSDEERQLSHVIVKIQKETLKLLEDCHNEFLENVTGISEDEMEINGDDVDDMVGGPLRSDMKKMSDDDDVSLGSSF